MTDRPNKEPRYRYVNVPPEPVVEKRKLSPEPETPLTKEARRLMALSVVNELGRRRASA